LPDGHSRTNIFTSSTPLVDLLIDPLLVDGSYLAFLTTNREHYHFTAPCSM